MEKALSSPRRIERVVKKPAFIPTLLFSTLVATLIISLSVSAKPPRIDRIVPEIGLPGGVLVVEGENFGSERGRSSVAIGSVRPTSSSYLEWTDSRISVQIPEEATSGLVRVTGSRATSNGVLFTNRRLIPIVLEERAAPGYPLIESVVPAKGSVGSLVTITGLNFGLSRGDGAVLFTGLPTGEEGVAVGLFTPASVSDYDYESWTEQTVRVRIPDGASSGTVRIVTDRGESNSHFFEVVRSGGTKSLGGRRGFQIEQSIEIDRVGASEGSVIALWVPGPTATFEQRNVESVHVPEPQRNEDSGIVWYSISAFELEATYRLESTYWLERYSVDTRIDPAYVQSAYDTQRKLYRHYTGEDAFVPAEDEGIALAAESAAGKQTNPYLAARNIFYFLLTRLSYDRKPSEKGVLGAFIAAKGSAQDYALLYCAMLRSRGIPARPVTGVLVYDNRRTVRHVWAEFYLEGYGWVPVDPVLADGVRFGDFPEIDNPEAYYFGNIDEQRITFARGIVGVPIDADLLDRGETRLIATVPSLQSIHEYATSGVEYRSRWNPIEIVYFW